MLVATKALGLLLTPPALLILLALLGLLIQIRWRHVGLTVTGLALALLALLSSPPVGTALIHGLEADSEPLALASVNGHGDAHTAIVVLGGGREADAPEYGTDTVSIHTLQRLRYAARLHRTTGWPLLVSGGSVYGEEQPEAELMREALVRDFAVTPRWLERRSRTTFENALHTRTILEAEGIVTVYLVTHAWHMPRARWAFAEAGLRVIPAPTGFNRVEPDRPRLLRYLPSAQGLQLSSRALSERLGLIWYRWSQRAGDSTRATEAS
ncbi:hypothetical protein SVA_0171 [Sulfurifustis variabilis]|uniref:DUF218 domain-containing protein n=1 Tax=Sulfurifustis variabilis TaxID=1675686 RepID=A0A1B4V0E3_9GAMM|nr:YdcF family protein [Sulfurifustis variabilis]BAU46753.1 hypothetical protein SVA_0171 [Sulfurifustis variabilis]